MPPPSHTLVPAVRRGDERAFAQFYELWFDRAVAAVRKLTRRDESFCLDVVQDWHDEGGQAAARTAG